MTDVVLDPCGGGPNCLEQCVVGSLLLASGCLRSRSVKIRTVNRGPARLLASESALGSLLFREV
jgi:hypothetical protein